ncbi:magnesium/cobalt transporter CorA [Lacinutrix undariae]
MKAKKRNKVYKTSNLPPGTLAYRGVKNSADTALEVINYNAEVYKIFQSITTEDGFNFIANNHITWINVNGLNNVLEIEKLGQHYKLHSLTLEDILNTNHRPKIDEFDDYLFLVFKMLHFKEDGTLTYEQVSLVAGEDFVLTFQEADGDVFDELRNRISTGKGVIRTQGADYLMYAILDAIVDNYITVIEAFGDQIEDLETLVFDSKSNESETPSQIQKLKHEVLKIRRSVLPLREVINRLEKSECKIIEDKTRSYLRDLQDHIVQVTETIDMYREMIWSIMDMHMSLISNKMNEVMKVLTIIATIFIPLTFIAGIYGMNFNNMPELQYKYGYQIVWAVMIMVLIIMLIYFRKKKWL